MEKIGMGYWNKFFADVYSGSGISYNVGVLSSGHWEKVESLAFLNWSSGIMYIASKCYYDRRETSKKPTTISSIREYIGLVNGLRL